MTYAAFDLESLSRIEDKDIEQAVFDYIFVKLNAKPNQARPVIAALPKGLQVFYTTWLVESEVANGGFHQYFWNSSSEFAEETPAALAAIGDPVASELMIQALKTALAEMPVTLKYKRERTLQAFSASAKQSKLNIFDASFWKRAEAFPRLRVQYLRVNPNLFVTERP